MKTHPSTSQFKQSQFSNPSSQYVEDDHTTEIHQASAEPRESGHYHLLSVAVNTLNWWEEHQFDLVEAGDMLVFRFSKEPSFVTHARDLYAQFSPA